MKRLAMIVLSLALLTAAGCSKPAPTAAPAPANPAAQAPMVNLSPADLLQKYKAGEKLLIIDVRTEEEFAEGHIPGAKLVPLQTLEKGIAAYKKDQELYLICRSGNRSAQAYTILQSMGYKKLINVTGGMTAWTALGGPVER